MWEFEERRIPMRGRELLYLKTKCSLQLERIFHLSITVASACYLKKILYSSGTKKQVASKRATMEVTSTMNGESQEATQPTFINKPSVCVVSSGEKNTFHCLKGTKL
ncbi:hypothetical protein Bca4012_019923 [Brassica carinata]